MRLVSEKEVFIIITGRLVEINDSFYVVLNLKHPDGSRWQKRINLELPVKNNRRRANERLQELRIAYTRQQQIQNGNGKMLVSDYLWKWLEDKRPDISPTTHHGYRHILECHMAPYFAEKRLMDITYQDVEAYYSALYEKKLSGTTIQHHHMILSQVFHTACRKAIIDRDPMIFVNKPKRAQPKVNYYSQAEARKLWEVVSGHKLEVVIRLTLYYGFRRSEVLGLKWGDVDFKSGSITVNRAVVNEFSREGRMTVRDKDELKGKASRRTMPMCNLIQELLQTEYERKKRFQNEYICTDSRGQLIKPDEVTAAFRTLLKKEGLRLIRFHDIRHTCASLMIAERIPLIEVQHWLGHSTMLTTADLYSHLEYTMKIPSAEALKKI